MESSMAETKRRLKLQIPEIESSLAAVRLLAEKRDAGGEPFTVRYNLSDQAYATAEVAPVGTVNLWLGANVMLEYTYDEAAALLADNLSAAVAKREEVAADLDFLKDQITTTEVNTARAYNYDVVARRAQKRAGGGAA
jgi:prefoldin subunit 5